MLELHELTYLAIITIESPGLREPIQVSVKLLPPSYVELVSQTAGEQQLIMKRLSDCTLGELQSFAQTFESDLAEDIKQIHLQEFADDTGSLLKIKILNDKKVALPSKDEIWQGAMLVSAVAMEDIAQVISPVDSELIELSQALNDSESPNEPDFTFLPEGRGTLAKKATVLAQALLDDVVDGAATAAAVASAAASAAADALAERRQEPLATEQRHEAPLLEEIAIIDFSDSDGDQADSAEDADEVPSGDGESDETADIADDQGEAVEEIPIKDDGADAEEDLFPDVRILIDDTEPVHEVRQSTGPDGVVQIPDGDKLYDRMAGQVLSLDDPTPAAVDILMAESAFLDAKRHASSSMNREVAGVLVGPHPQKQPNGRYVVQVTDAIVAEHTRMQGASVTYTPESWRYVNDKLHEMYPDEECVIVGWYHTHPGFGIFLSNMDLFIHHNFFTQKWHIALVLDPVGKQSGFFNWDRSQSQMMATHFPWPYWAHSSW